MAKQLTARQRVFVAELARGSATPAAAAAAAGYSESNAAQAASRLMRNKLVQEALAQARRDEAERTGVSENYVIARLREIVERVGTKDADLIRALELLGKYLGLWDAKGKPEEMGIKIEITQEAEEWSV